MLKLIFRAPVTFFVLKVVHIASREYSQNDFIFFLQNLATLVVTIATFLRNKKKIKIFLATPEKLFSDFFGLGSVK